MVRNTTGGSKTKGQARKLINSDSKSANKMLRLSTDPYEVYAQVTKNLGNGMCHVLCMDGKTRLCHIRGKFRGRGKRDNMAVLGSWILAGLREWEAEREDSSKKLENCDLLEVYNDHDKEKLKSMVPHINWSHFISNDNKNSKIQTDVDNIEFTENADEYRELLEEQLKKGGGKLDTIQLRRGDKEEEEEEINIDDI